MNDKITSDMQIIGIDHFPFSTTELKKCFREKIMIYHPDKYKGKENAQEKSIEILSAYKSLNNVTSDFDPHIKIEIKEDNIFDIYYKECTWCDGEGFTLDKKWSTHICIKCKDTNIYKMKCNRCTDGKFTLKNKRVVTCNACKGTTIFETKCNHRVSFRDQHFYDMFNQDRTYKVVRRECQQCKGTGKEKYTPVNPVIPKGGIL